MLKATKQSPWPPLCLKLLFIYQEPFTLYHSIEFQSYYKLEIKKLFLL